MRWWSEMDRALKLERVFLDLRYPVLGFAAGSLGTTAWEEFQRGDWVDASFDLGICVFAAVAAVGPLVLRKRASVLYERAVKEKVGG